MLLGFFLTAYFLLNYKKLNDPTWSALLRGVSGYVTFIILFTYYIPTPQPQGQTIELDLGVMILAINCCLKFLF